MSQTLGKMDFSSMWALIVMGIWVLMSFASLTCLKSDVESWIELGFGCYTFLFVGIFLLSKLEYVSALNAFSIERSGVTGKHS